MHGFTSFKPPLFKLVDIVILCSFDKGSGIMLWFVYVDDNLISEVTLLALMTCKIISSLHFTRRILGDTDIF